MQITRFRICTELNWSTKKLNFCVIWRWSLVVIEYFCKRKGDQNQINLVAALLVEYNLTVFKSILSLPPMWSELEYFLLFVILVWPTWPPSVNPVTIMSSWKLQIGEKEFSHSLRTSSFPCSKKGKRNLVEDHYFDNQSLMEDFSSIRKMD